MVRKLLRTVAQVGGVSVMVLLGVITVSNDTLIASHYRLRTGGELRSSGIAPKWIIAESAVEAIQRSGSAASVDPALDSLATTIILQGSVPLAQANWHVHFAQDARSLAKVGATASSPGPASAILYDPEDWSSTPLWEQEHPVEAIAQAAADANVKGLSLIAAPGTDLALLTGGGQIYAHFLSAGVLGGAAQSSTAIDIQAQGLVRDPSQYAAYVRRAVQQIRAVSSSVQIYAGISTALQGRIVGVSVLTSDLRRTRALVTGYWLNVPGANSVATGPAEVAVATSLLKKFS
ncbi:MAG: hypothetical protein ACYDHP_02975 [Ferrimicrobium sp.]